MDSGKVKVLAMTTAGALAAFLLYRLLTKGGKATASVGSQGPFIGRIDQRAPLDIKQQEAHSLVLEYINRTFKG